MRIYIYNVPMYIFILNTIFIVVNVLTYKGHDNFVTPLKLFEVEKCISTLSFEHNS